MRSFGSATEHLLSKRRLGHGRRRAPVSALFADFLALFNALQISSMRTVRNLMTESCTRIRRSNSFTISGSDENCRRT